MKKTILLNILIILDSKGGRKVGEGEMSEEGQVYGNR